MYKKDQRKYAKNLTSNRIKTSEDFVNIIEEISSIERVNKCRLNKVFGQICELFDSFCGTIHIRDKGFIAGYDEKGNFQREDVLFLFHLYIDKNALQTIFEGKNLTEIEKELRDESDHIYMRDGGYLETQCILGGKKSVVCFYPSSGDGLSHLCHLRTTNGKIKSSIAVPFRFSIPLKSRHEVDGVVTLHSMRSEARPDSYKYCLGEIASVLGSSFGATFGNIPVNSMNELQGFLIGAHRFGDKLSKVCEMAAGVTAALPRGAYSHIRVFIPLRSRKCPGVLRMEGNAGYKKPVEKIGIEARNRLFMKDYRVRKKAKQRESMSIHAFGRALDEWKKGLLTAEKLDEYSFRLADVQINKERSPYAARIPGYESDINNPNRTLSHFAVPILAGDGSPLGILTLNSSEFAWLNFCWLPIAVQFAKEASWVIEHEKGFTITKNKELRIIPETTDKSTQDLLRQVYLDETVHKRMLLEPLTGYGKGKNYIARICHPIRQSEIMSLHIVRLMDRNTAEIERRAYEIYVKNFLGSTGFSPKVGEALTHDKGLITYLMLGRGGLSFPSLGKVISDNKHEDINIWDTGVERIKAILEDLFGNLLRNWHSDGPGTFVQYKEWPNIVQCYDRTEGLITRGENPQDLFDRDLPGLFSRSKLYKAHSQYRGVNTETANMIKKIVDEYKNLHKGLANAVPHPYIGICHGDLHDRNILVGGTDERNENAWIIDFDRVHRGHVLQDFTRLESYIQHLIVGKYSDLDEAKDVLRHLYEILPEEPGEKQPEVQMRRNMDTLHLSGDLRYLVTIIQDIRAHARDLVVERLRSQRGGDFRLEYYVSLFFEYLDWFTFPIWPRGEARDFFITGVRNLAIAADLLLKRIKPLAIR